MHKQVHPITVKRMICKKLFTVSPLRDYVSPPLLAFLIANKAKSFTNKKSCKILPFSYVIKIDRNNYEI